MSFDWETNPLRQKYRSICNDNDSLQMAQIIDEGISSPDPTERAHWLTVKALQYGEHPEMPGHMDRAWDTIELALQTAPDPGLFSFRCVLLQMALAACSFEGPVHRFPGLLRPLRPGLRRMLRAPAVSYNVAIVCHQAGRLRQARRWLERAFRANYMETKSELSQVGALAFGAWLSFELARIEEGEHYLQASRRLFGVHGDGRPRHYLLAMAETWAALEQGRLREARSSLQQHMVTSPHRSFPLYVFQSHAVAARLALAEGNPSGYRHHYDQALAVCRAHDLTLSRQYLQVMTADTERKYGAAQG